MASSGEAVGLVPWLVSLLPVNPIAAAASGNMVSLILFTLLLAVAIAKSSPASRETLLAFFRALADAMLVLVRWVVAAAPIGIFGLMLPLAAHGGAGVAGAVGAYIVIYSVGVYRRRRCSSIPAMAVFGRVPLSTFARAALPAQLIAFSSSSSVASLPALVGAAAELRTAAPRHRLRAAAGRLGVQVRRPGVVDHRRALHRALLRHSARRCRSS